MNKSIELMQLEESLEAEYTAFCTKCGEDLTSHDEKYRFAKSLLEEGWRVSDVGDMCCPKCAKTFITNTK
jgi:hypothetical protein